MTQPRAPLSDRDRDGFARSRDSRQATQALKDSIEGAREALQRALDILNVVGWEARRALGGDSTRPGFTDDLRPTGLRQLSRE